ncbi:MAG: hypothetical protein A2Y33_11970 [Spirochaetes bacterium GWF1_51_8]|nr:MAG: hypothetical protein A2Y33_11970 [Spirochaetes bacterium GWF1_51_8]
MTLKRITLLFLLLVVPALLLFSIDLPYNEVIPVYPGFQFSLVSEKSNTLKIKTAIDLPENYVDYKKFDMLWQVRLKYDGVDYEWMLRFRVEKNGDMYLEEISDDYTTRVIPHSASPLFPRETVLGNPIVLGKNISWVVVKKVPSIKLGTKNYSDVYMAELTLSGKKVTIYLAKKRGIVGIVLDGETFAQ